MEKLFERYLEKLPDNIKEEIQIQVKGIDNPNPNERLQKGCLEQLKKLLEEKTVEFDILRKVAILCCYLTQKMKANKEFLSLLKKVNTPYIQLFIEYFAENPSNYLEALARIESLSQDVEESPEFNEEIRAHILNIHSWVYGQQGDTTKIKEIYKYTRKRIPQTDNAIEQFGLQDA
ncbi:MAG: hypothetical protein ACTSRO_03270 [Candidatus Heimdallarchaeaceae archaeon]